MHQPRQIAKALTISDAREKHSFMRSATGGVGNLACAFSFELWLDFTGAPSFPPLFYGKGGGLDAGPPTSRHQGSPARCCNFLRLCDIPQPLL
jgi:hypothetical protein